MSDIFISHKREDQEIARRIANALETDGWTVWWDPKLRAGEHFDEVIEEALTAAKCVVVLWSAGSVKSQYVRDEATYALECKKLVPVAIEAVEMPFRFRGVVLEAVMARRPRVHFPVCRCPRRPEALERPSRSRDQSVPTVYSGRTWGGTSRRVLRGQRPAIFR